MILIWSISLTSTKMLLSETLLCHDTDLIYITNINQDVTFGDITVSWYLLIWSILQSSDVYMWFSLGIPWWKVTTNKLLSLMVRLKSPLRNFTLTFMTWLTFTVYLCQRWHWYVPFHHSHNSFLPSSFMTYYRICKTNNTTITISGAENS